MKIGAGCSFRAEYHADNRLAAKLDGVLESLARSLTGAPDTRLRRTMRFPDRWDPFFEPEMSLAEVYAYLTRHFDFHQRQLSL